MQFARLVSPGTYQFNVIVPSSAPVGEDALAATYGGFTTQAGVQIAVGSGSGTGNDVRTLSAVNPNSGAAGKTLTVVVTGVKTNFVQGQTLVSFGSDTSVGGAPFGQAGTVTVVSPTSAVASVMIDPSAAVGSRTVTVKTVAQSASLVSGFNVLAAPAALGPLTITSTLPASGAADVAATSPVQIVFNETLDVATVGPSTFLLANSHSALPVSIGIDSTGTVVTLTPSGVLFAKCRRRRSEFLSQRRR